MVHIADKFDRRFSNLPGNGTRVSALTSTDCCYSLAPVQPLPNSQGRADRTNIHPSVSSQKRRVLVALEILYHRR